MDLGNQDDGRKPGGRPELCRLLRSPTPEATVALVHDVNNVPVQQPPMIPDDNQTIRQSRADRMSRSPRHRERRSSGASKNRQHNRPDNYERSRSRSTRASRRDIDRRSERPNDIPIHRRSKTRSSRRSRHENERRRDRHSRNALRGGSRSQSSNSRSRSKVRDRSSSSSTNRLRSQLLDQRKRRNIKERLSPKAGPSKDLSEQSNVLMQSFIDIT